MTTLLVEIAKPILRSVINIGVGRLSGATINRSDNKPTAATITTATKQPAQIAACDAMTAAAIMPPSIAHSPCAKLSAPVLLKMTLNPKAMSA